MKNLNIILAVIGGAIAGAAVGMLLAPKRGSETREEIIDFVKDKCPFLNRNKVEELADRIAEEIRHA
ncbi:MAG: YtxH domain-containing protein [Bacteroidales bacterium]|nr:YtxH domain-containing protein [Bacteroidales bacterium]MCD8387581.1 YtxH domain-containing protein [Bacteroidales bacterium]